MRLPAAQRRSAHRTSCGADACAAAALAEASPIRFVDSRDPPVLLIYGTEDRQVLPVQSEAFAERVRAAEDARATNRYTALVDQAQVNLPVHA